MRIVHKLRDRLTEEEGIALPFVAVILVLLLGMAAFAVDLGWIFLSSSHIQRAADSASLAGVVYLPGDTAGVNQFTVSGAQANGYSIGRLNGSPVAGGGPDELEWEALDDNRLHVTLHSSVPTFFLKVFGFHDIDITRDSTAEYIKPVPIGSPTNCFGIGPGVSFTGIPNSARNQCNTATQNFWGAVNGRRTAKQHGDPYLVTCAFDCPGSNPDFNPTFPYYYYGIEVPSGKTSLDVYLYDAGFYDRDNFAETGDEDDLTNSNTGGTNMTFTLFRPDPTPLIARDNNQLANCTSGTTNNLSINSGASSNTYRNKWVLMCHLGGTTGNPIPPGIYVLRVANGGTNIGGSNSYAILLNSNNVSGSVPRVYAIDTMSIFTNSPSGNATVYLADIDPVHKGKILELRFFDPGEGNGTTFMTVTPPPGTTLPGSACSWSVSGPNVSGCRLRTTVNGNAQYNGQWVEVRIKIPDNYNCGSDCFWKMNLQLNTAHDRTTWEAHVIGNPVRLTPNE